MTGLDAAGLTATFSVADPSTLRRKYLCGYRLEADHNPPDDPSALLTPPERGIRKQPILRPDRGLWSSQSVK